MAEPLPLLSAGAEPPGFGAGVCRSEPPVRAGLVGDALHYPWSSAAGHIEGRDPSGTMDLASWKELQIRGDWRELLESEVVQGRAGELRLATRSRLPFGDQQFVKELESRSRRCLERRPPGPVPKSKGASATG